MVVSGIAGIMTRNGDAAPGRMLRAMGAALAHRGPEGEGHYRSGDCGMVETRLACETAGDAGPVYDPTGAALVADGAIYNAPELAREFVEDGSPVESDWALPLLLYRRNRPGFTDMRGMYAIALHDPSAGRLVLARDPFGIKPLYYAETTVGFAFASEPGALVAAGLVNAQLVRQVRSELMQSQFTTGRETIFAGIQRLLPGGTVVVARGRIAEHLHRDGLPTSAPPPVDEPAALARLHAVLENSVLLHQRADVPYGMFLSGGVDSSAVLAMM